MDREKLVGLLAQHHLPADAELPFEDVTFDEAFDGATVRVRALSPMEQRRAQTWVSLQAGAELDAWIVHASIAAVRWGLVDEAGDHLLASYDEATSFVFVLYDHPKDNKKLGEVIARLRDKVAPTLPAATDENPSPPAGG